MGKHGGINILHQKSWHVWRLDNRLTVERDELRHAEEEREKKRADDQAAFSAKLQTLRRRAEALDDDGATAEEPTPAVIAGEGGGSSGSGSRGSVSHLPEKKNSTLLKQEASYKYGMVTTSNLKAAEKDLDAILRGKGKGTGRNKSCSGSGALGTGPHINLFEDAELEHKRHVEEHHKQVGYTQRNNELACKSKKALFSEFDEIAADVPWYLRGQPTKEVDLAGKGVHVSSTPACQLEEELWLAARSRSRSRPRRRWTERHGQAVVQVKPSTGDTTMKILAGTVVGTFGVKQPKVKKEKKTKSHSDDTRKRKEERKRERKEQGRHDLAVLRVQRELREAKERARAAGLVRAPA